MLDLLTSREAAELLRIREATLRQWRHRGIGPRYVRLTEARNARVRYQRAELLRWLSLS